MTKQEKEVVSIKYSGKIEGLTFEKFDDLVVRWGRKRWGDKYAKALWQNELIKVGDLDLLDDLDAFTFEAHCEAMYDTTSCRWNPQSMQLSCSTATDFGQRNGKWKTGNDKGRKCFAI